MEKAHKILLKKDNPFEILRFKEKSFEFNVKKDCYGNY